MQMVVEWNSPSNELWYFLRGVGASRWLQVVVAYEGDHGWIVTAFGRRQEL